MYNLMRLLCVVCLLVDCSHFAWGGPAENKRNLSIDLAPTKLIGLDAPRAYLEQYFEDRKSQLFPHRVDVIAFIGAPKLGKTALSVQIAKTSGDPVVVLNANTRALQSAGALEEKIYSAITKNPRTVFIIDGYETMSAQVRITLDKILDDNRIQLSSKKVARLNLSAFIVIASIGEHQIHEYRKLVYDMIDQNQQTVDAIKTEIKILQGEKFPKKVKRIGFSYTNMNVNEYLTPQTVTGTVGYAMSGDSAKKKKVVADEITKLNRALKKLQATNDQYIAQLVDVPEYNARHLLVTSLANAGLSSALSGLVNKRPLIGIPPSQVEYALVFSRELEQKLSVIAENLGVKVDIDDQAVLSFAEAALRNYHQWSNFSHPIRAAEDMIEQYFVNHLIEVIRQKSDLGLTQIKLFAIVKTDINPSTQTSLWFVDCNDLMHPNNQAAPDQITPDQTVGTP